MKKVFVVLLVIVAVFLLLQKGRKSSKALCDLGGDTIVILGDSIANNYSLNKEQNFGAIIANKLNKKIYIKATNGLKTDGLASTINEDLAQVSSVAAVLISIGGNDILKKESLANVEKNLAKILQSAKAKSSCVVLLAEPNGALEAISGSVADFYIKASREFGVLLDDKSMPKILKNRSLLSDQIHPNAAGHELIAKNMLELLQN